MDESNSRDMENTCVWVEAVYWRDSTVLNEPIVCNDISLSHHFLRMAETEERRWEKRDV